MAVHGRTGRSTRSSTNVTSWSTSCQSWRLRTDGVKHRQGSPVALRAEWCRCVGQDGQVAPLEAFSEPTRTWFGAAFAEPTAGAGGCLAGDRRRAARAGGGAHRVRQDAERVPVVDRPAAHARAAREGEALPGPLRLPAQGPGRRRRAQPARAADRDPADRRAARRERAGAEGRGAVRRHQRRRPAQAGHHAARHPDHHPRVAVPDADQPGPRVAARRRDRDRRRGARRRRHQARRPPRASASSASTPCSTSRPSGSGSAPPCARWRRWRGSSAARRRSRSWRRHRRSGGTSRSSYPSRT